MAVAVANARLNVEAPARKPRRFGLLSVADVVDGGDQHWLLGGLTADGEECSKPLSLAIVCGQSATKTPRSWYSDIGGDPWLSYMYETCKTVGRVNEAADKLRNRFLAAEPSAVERGFQAAVLSKSTAISGPAASVAQAIGALEKAAGSEYGGQITLHLPFTAAEEAASRHLFERVGDHLETVAGNLVSIGNYDDTADGGTAAVPVIYATGATVLYRGGLSEAGPVIAAGGPAGTMTNDYYVLVERAYAALVDCFNMRITATLCGCGPATP